VIGTRFGADIDRLTAECSLPGLGYAPHPRHNLSALPELLSWEMDRHGDRSHRRLVVLGVDGMRYRDARQAFSRAEIGAWTATFPSTSIAGWTSSLTGQPVGRHGLAGPVLRNPATGRTADLLAPDDPPWPPSGGETVFEAMGRAGTRSIALLGGLEPYRGSGWLDAMVRGADTPRPVGSRAATAPACVRTAFWDVEAVLTDRAADRSLLVWCHVDLDFFVHANGYDADVHAALAELDERAAALSDDRTTVVAYADHGLTASDHDAGLTAFWSELNQWAAAAPPGGAGRVVWCYPAAGREDAAVSALEAELGQNFRVLHLDDLVSHGLLGPAPAPVAHATIGRIVVLPLGRHYFSPAAPARFEHGSLTADEMFVPVARWASA
jgi:hypothetical protein